ncbi:efflux RND transporter periplasmic adaptor subunit [Lysobacter sp. GX 14042]|uniref:efflux RND transporter periplasmic adaptor subunit n=1 Tax=Lysobacter sp. GX 14042 TaxID=2907155 RepID=UPI001F1F05EE|nr:efflux RND transporter periplasmic adaptor subunit [Lysobacter sp. GX 14042]MCE7031404.1 efflux RND transporter periplasmic adaptor subunit [Lysobacter sp. GX 14042]
MRQPVSRRARHRGFFRASAAATRLSLIGSVLLGGVLVAGGLTACGGPGQGPGEATAEAEAAPVPVEVALAERRPMAASYTGTAALEAPGEAQVVAKTSGVALEVLVAEGERIKAGQVLVRLDSDRARLQEAQTGAQMRKLEAEFARSQSLAEQQLLSAADFDRIRFDLENARAANRLAQLEVSYANVTSPISGVVAQVTPKHGNFVQINTPIVRVVDTSRLEATLNVPERELATLRAGQPVTLQVDALPGQDFEGRIDRISPVVDAGSGTFRVIAAFEGRERLQPGMFGRLRIDYDQRADALVVPRAALVDAQGVKAEVLVVDDGIAVRTPVELGYVDGAWVEVREGVAPGARVVVAGKAAVRDGGKVTVIDPDAPAVAAGQAGDAAPAAVQD